ncbi:MAG: hypothetical protein ABSB88_10030 [Bryobacteraceae bacterium]|jgi:hypothetical protein
MKKQLFAIAAGLTLMATGLPAQSGTVTISRSAQIQTGTVTKDGSVTINTANGVTQFFTSQQADTLGTFVFVGGGRGGQGVTGSPVSAREETRTVQTLGDGTQLDSSEVSQFYRDSQGRTRTERTVDGGTNIQILDPVASVRIMLDPAAKSATRVTMVIAAGRGGRGGAVNVSVATSAEPYVVALEPRVAAATTNQQLKREDLGLQMQNGVMAEGTRVTRTIPAGTIGNNRDIHVVNEQWYSKDLQMMVKTVNSDPRFGVTTYEMTNISQTAPDAGLFMIPAGYTITEQAGRGGRGAPAGQTTGGGR